MEIHQENDMASEETANTNSEQRKAAKLKGDLEKLQVWLLWVWGWNEHEK